MKNKLHKASGKDLSSLLFADSAISLLTMTIKMTKNNIKPFSMSFFYSLMDFFNGEIHWYVFNLLNHAMIIKAFLVP